MPFTCSPWLRHSYGYSKDLSDYRQRALGLIARHLPPYFRNKRSWEAEFQRSELKASLLWSCSLCVWPRYTLQGVLGESPKPAKQRAGMDKASCGVCGFFLHRLEDGLMISRELWCCFKCGVAKCVVIVYEQETYTRMPLHVHDVCIYIYTYIQVRGFEFVYVYKETLLLFRASALSRDGRRYLKPEQLPDVPWL